MNFNQKAGIALLITALLLTSCAEAEKEKNTGEKSSINDRYEDTLAVKEVPKPRPYPEPLPDSVKQRRFVYGADTQEELCDILLDALARQDTLTLTRLMVSEYEFKNWLWWEFPASQPIRNVPVDFAWGNLLQNADKGLRQALGKYSGRRLYYVSHKFLEGQDRYQTFIVHTKTRVTAADSTGRQYEIKVFGSFVEMNGRFKLMSYRDRD